MPPKGVNQKVVAANAKKAEAAAQKQSISDKQREALEAEEWNKGANQRKASKEQDAAAKADEAARKKREKEELLKAEEAALGSGGKAKISSGPKKSNNKPKNDLAMLEAALVSAADKKVKKKKELEQKKKDDEMNKLRAAEEKRQQAAASLDPLLANTEKMLAGMLPMENDEVGRLANVKLMEDGTGGSGIDAALQSMNLTGSSGTGGQQQQQSAKALYAEFEAKTMPIVKAENPGLRLSQYKEKIWNLWKKSPDNPANFIIQQT